MKIAILDDELIWQEKVSQIIKNNEFQEAKNIVDLYSSGEEYLEKEEIYDVTFVDIEMPGIDGFETIRRARKYNANGIYIILTNHIEMSRKGYMVNAFRFLHKYSLEEEIKEALDSVNIILRRNDVICLNIIGYGERNIVLKDIVCFETKKKHYVIIHTKEGELRCSNTMTEIENLLQNTWFYRCHQGYIVNLDEIKSIEKRIIYLSNGQDIDIAYRKVTECRREYMKRLYECGIG